jgi:uncharacterized protein YeaO (DUF488 family)
MSSLRLSTYRLGSTRQPGEGLRIGTVRFLPRGVRKQDYASQNYFDVWFPLVAPSADLIRWYRSQPSTTDATWKTFVRRYTREMRHADARQALELLAKVAQQTPIAIGCYCEDENQCHRSVLAGLISEAGEQR